MNGNQLLYLYMPAVPNPLGLALLSRVHVSITDVCPCHSVWTSNRSQAVKWRCEGINRTMAIPGASTGRRKSGSGRT
ncbi:hypothetical protein RRG08_027759 [Elysia crispata]|uniref:Uncharacterized protein n=1 Tax=Elysia crispata TaxID=231223 RepID=A0AAE1DD79_9GAST|nr:hypothetical protein RRG08_027759 [Elysia crispata]